MTSRIILEFLPQQPLALPLKATEPKREYTVFLVKNGKMHVAKISKLFYDMIPELSILKIAKDQKHSEPLDELKNQKENQKEKEKEKEEKK